MNAINTPAPGKCDCGDPDCRYVANLASEITWLEGAVGGSTDDSDHHEEAVMSGITLTQQHIDIDVIGWELKTPDSWFTSEQFSDDNDADIRAALTWANEQLGVAYAWAEVVDQRTKYMTYSHYEPTALVDAD